MKCELCKENHKHLYKFDISIEQPPKTYNDSLTYIYDYFICKQCLYRVKAAVNTALMGLGLEVKDENFGKPYKPYVKKRRL